MRIQITLLFVAFASIVNAQSPFTKNINSTPVANFSASTDSLCQHGSVNFTDLSTNSPTSWKWYFTGGIPDTSTKQNPTNIVYPVTGNYNVKLVVKNGSGMDSLTKAMYIHVDSIGTCFYGGAINLCQGFTTSICATCGTQWVWSTGQTTSCITVKPPGTITYTVEIVNGRCVVDTTVTIIVDTMPQIRFKGDTAICSGDSTTLYVSGGGTYLWSVGSTYDSIRVAPHTTTTYTVQVRKGACFRDTVITVKVICTGIPNIFNPSQINIFPNPATNQLTVSFDTPPDKNSILSITDITGRMLSTYPLSLTPSLFSINTSGLSSGMYFLNLKTDYGIVAKKFVKE